MQTIVLTQQGGALVQSLAKTDAESASPAIPMTRYAGDAQTRERVITELTDQVVHDYRDALRRLGREPHP